MHGGHYTEQVCRTPSHPTRRQGHMVIGIILVSIGSYFVLRFLYRHEKLDNPDSPELAELKREIWIWQRTMHRLNPVCSQFF